MVERINPYIAGAPVTDPAMIHVRLAVTDGIPVTQFRQRALAIAADHLERIPLLIDQMIAGKIEVF